MATDALLAAAGQAAATIQSSKRKRWMLACDIDADGLTAAAVMAVALRRIGHRYTVRASRDKTRQAYDELMQAEVDGWIFLDKGSSHLREIRAASGGKPVLVIDHHNVDDGVDGVQLVNPRAVGLDGSRDASSSTAAAAVALQMQERNLDQAATALAGAVGDWQHLGGWRGWNAELMQNGTEAGHVGHRKQPRFVGVRLAEAVAHHQPPIPGFQGDPAKAETWLRKNDLPPDADVEELDQEQQNRLVSQAAACILAAGGDDDAIGELVEEAWWHAGLDTSIRNLFRIVDACGRLGHAGVGIALLLGDQTARAEAESIFREYKQTLAAGIQELGQSGTEAMQAVQVAWTREPAFTGMVAGIGMTHVVEDRSRPIAMLAKRGDGAVQVSTRGSHEHVEAGMDLGRAVQEAAAKVDAEGGGHPIAAGAVIDEPGVRPFLDALDAALVAQGWKS